MRSVIEIISTKRSGHHAFIAWLGQNSGKPSTFFNSVTPSNPPRLRPPIFFHADGQDRRESRIDILLKDDCDVLLNFEGKLPTSIEQWNENYLLPQLNGRLHRIVFLRDPANMLASLAKRVPVSNPRGRFGFFYQALAFEEILARLHDNRARLCDRIVCFSAWLTSEQYRAKLAKELGLATWVLPGKITSFGGGSSFEGMDFDPAAQTSELFDRWREVKDNSIFLAPFADETFQAAARYYFELMDADEIVKIATLDEVIARAKKSGGARALAHGFLAPMRRARNQIAHMEYAPQPLVRLAWKSLIRARMALRM